MTVTEAATAPADPAEAASTESAPSGDLLKVGDTVTSSTGSMTLLAAKDPAPGENYDEPSAGMRFVSVHIEQCSDAGESSTFVSEFVFIDKDGGEYSSDRTMHGWPTPAFPQFIDLAPGDCKQGWMALELKGKVEFKSIIYRLATGETIGEWELSEATKKENSTGDMFADNFPKGFPKKVALSEIPSPINSAYEGFEFAVQLAPGVYTSLPPGANLKDAAFGDIADGYCASIDAFVKRYRDGAEMGGSCW